MPYSAAICWKVFANQRQVSGAYCGEAVQLSVEGPLRILGPSVVPLRGGMAGTYLATTGEAGPAKLHCRMEGALDAEVSLTIRCREE